MGNQRTFASMAWNGKGKVTRRERFLAEMDAVIPWPRLVRGKLDLGLTYAETFCYSLRVLIRRFRPNLRGSDR